MCLDELSNADIKAISKTRGFNDAETASRSQLAAVFLSSIGVEAAMQTLSYREAVCLHLMHLINEPVRLDFFERLYPDDVNDNRFTATTFTKTYQPIFKKVKNNLIRKGLLLFAESHSSKKGTILERTEFYFPEAFASYLPPLLPDTISHAGPNESRQERVWRHVVLQIFSQVHHEGEIRPELIDGRLMIEDCLLNEAALIWWSLRKWDEMIDARRFHQEKYSLTVIEAFEILLDDLATDAWVSPDGMWPAFDLFCYLIKAPPLEDICDLGWKWGLLDRLVMDGQAYYRLLDAPSKSEEMPPEQFLQVLPDGDGVEVNLKTIPIPDLTVLNQLVSFDISGKKLIARPSFADLGRFFQVHRNHRLMRWLSEHVPGFQNVFHTAEQRWGKTIFHHKLLVAKVEDLSLRVQIEKSLADDVICLSETMIAFPQNCRDMVEAILQRHGFVMKTRRAENA